MTKLTVTCVILLSEYRYGYNSVHGGRGELWVGNGAKVLEVLGLYM